MGIVGSARRELGFVLEGADLLWMHRTVCVCMHTREVVKGCKKTSTAETVNCLELGPAAVEEFAISCSCG